VAFVPGMEGIVAQRNAASRHNGQLTAREKKQLLVWGGVFFILFLGILFLLIGTGSIIPRL
jgi:type II secretory pathway component PulM